MCQRAQEWRTARRLWLPDEVKNARTPNSSLRARSGDAAQGKQEIFLSQFAKTDAHYPKPGEKFGSGVQKKSSLTFFGSDQKELGEDEGVTRKRGKNTLFQKSESWLHARRGVELCSGCSWYLCFMPWCLKAAPQPCCDVSDSWVPGPTRVLSKMTLQSERHLVRASRCVGDVAFL